MSGKGDTSAWTCYDPRIEHIPEAGCWVWVGDCSKDGYGRRTIKTKGVRRQMAAHRVFWESENGPVEYGLVLDHMCRNKACVNPSHLRAVTTRINVTENSTSWAARNVAKTHCPLGHPYNEENTKRKRTGRECRICANASVRQWAKKYPERKNASRRRKHV